MADALYLSLWYPNLRLEGLGDKLTVVLGEFARHGGEARVYAATVWPVSWHETPVFQRVWGRMAEAGEAQVVGAEPRVAVAEALELLHEDYAYEFQIGWRLWELEDAAAASRAGATAGPSTPVAAATSAQDDGAVEGKAGGRWARVTRLVRVTGYGPLFDDGSYEQDGHIRIDFGSDAPFLEEEAELDATAARHMAENVRQLVDLTAAAEKASGATARLLWSELGESLAQRLAERLGQRN
jgi:hypothetical protein